MLCLLKAALAATFGDLVAVSGLPSAQGAQVSCSRPGRFGRIKFSRSAQWKLHDTRHPLFLPENFAAAWLAAWLAWCAADVRKALLRPILKTFLAYRFVPYPLGPIMASFGHVNLKSEAQNPPSIVLFFGNWKAVPLWYLTHWCRKGTFVPLYIL